MALRQQSFAVGSFYHLYSRGVDKRKIFLTKQDYRKFLFLLFICNSEKSIVLRDIGKKFERGESIVEIGAYCLMPNHFHLLVREKIPGGISKFMRKVLTGYSMYFNQKNKRQGKLFDSPFKSSYAGADEYLKYLFSYIHLNPAKLIEPKWKTKFNKNSSDLFNYCATYPYSSLSSYINLSNTDKILIPKVFPNYFEKSGSHVSELIEWLTNTP